MTRSNTMKYFTLYILAIHIKFSRTSFTSPAELLCLLPLCLTTLALLPAVSVFCSSLSLEVPQPKNSGVLQLHFILFLNTWLCFPTALAVTQLSSCWTPLQCLNILAWHYYLLSYDLFWNNKRATPWWDLQNDSEKYFLLAQLIEQCSKHSSFFLYGLF